LPTPMHTRWYSLARQQRLPAEATVPSETARRMQSRMVL
jgi:hypothetical protein